ncbi:MAG TPA: dephospho-CoA kinase [Balneolaceae bacterium]|nr:dephospho-CoA kinase [Balneolaceae bacterium]
MITVGVTGGIGSGKTTVCRIWESLGAAVFYADDEAKNIMATEPGVISAIRKTFGDQAYTGEGELDRSYLSREAFEKGRVAELNRIVHPAVREKFSRDAKKARDSGIHLFVKEAALMDVTSGDGLDYIVIVASDLEKRVQRVISRDGTDRQSVMIRITRQPDFEALETHADFVIHNNGTPDELRKAAEELYTQLLELPGKPGN